MENARATVVELCPLRRPIYKEKEVDNAVLGNRLSWNVQRTRPPVVVGYVWIWLSDYW